MDVSRETLEKIKKLLASDGGGGGMVKVSGRDSGSGQNHDHGDVTRVLVLVNENSPIISALLFLRKRGYKIKIIHRLMDTIQELTAHEPDVLLISWNLRKTDVRKVYNLLAQKFSTLCIVFGEENNTKTSATLMGSGIPHTLLPPVSGPGMHMRIQALLRKRRNQAYQKRQVKEDNKFFVEPRLPSNGFSNDDFTAPSKQNSVFNLEDDLSLVGLGREDLTKIQTSEIPPETQWNSLQTGGNGDESIWKGTVEKDGKKSFYYFQGPSVPEFDSEKGGWNGFGSVEILRSNKDVNPRLVNALQSNTATIEKRAPTFENDDLGTGAPKKKNDGNIFGEEFVEELKKTMMGEDPYSNQRQNVRRSILTGGDGHSDINTDRENIAVSGVTDFSKDINQKQYEAVTTLKTKEKKTVLAQGVQKAVASVIKPSELGDATPIDILTKVTVTMIKTKRYHGYLVGANASDIPDYGLMEEVMESLGVALQDLGEPLNPTTGVLELELDPLPFMIWVESKAEFYVKSRHGNNEIAYAYIPFENMPEVVEASDTDVLVGVKLSSLNPGKPTLFNVYIHMPKNNKYLLYLKKGAVFETKTLTKLIKFGIKHLFIKKSEIDLYQTYCAKYKIAESYEEFTTKKAS